MIIMIRSKAAIKVNSMFPIKLSDLSRIKIKFIK